MPAEHLLRRLKAEAFAGRVIQPIAQGTDLVIGDVQHDRLWREIAPNASVGVLDRAFLPGRLRIAEPGRRSHTVRQLAP